MTPPALPLTAMIDNILVTVNLNSNGIGNTPPSSLTALIDLGSTICAATSGILYPNPASHQYFNHHPTQDCNVSHPNAISTVAGCSIHNGVLDAAGCSWCRYERQVGQFYNSIPIWQKIGYRP
jgi:hypothetical protein